MTENKITCNYLWKQWEKNDPRGYQVLQAQERIRSYSKKDWEDMAADAKHAMNEISLLIDKNIDVKDPRSELAFQKLLDHVQEYFFEPNKDYVEKLYILTLLSKDYIQFFDQFRDGMSIKILELIDAYPEKFK
jgi:hypothetical protein